MQLFIWTPETFVSFNLGSLADNSEQSTVCAAVPGDGVGRRRGESGGKGRGVHAAPNGGLGSPGGGRSWAVRGEGRSSSSVAAGEGVLVAQGGGSWVLEHHQSTRSARTGSGEAMRGGGGGSTASSSSPGLMADADREKRGSAPGSLPRGLYRLRDLARKPKQAWGVRNRGRSARPARWWRWTHGGRRGGLRRGRGCVSARGGARDGARWQEWALGTSWPRTSAVDGVRCHQGRQEEKREEKTGNGNSVNNPNYQILLCNFDFSPPRWTQMKNC